MQKGHSLIEVVFSISLWAVVLTEFLMILSMGFKIMSLTDQKFEVQTLAEEKMLQQIRIIGDDEQKILELDGKIIKEDDFTIKFNINNIEGSEYSMYENDPEHLETIPESEYCSFYEIEEVITNSNQIELARVKRLKWINLFKKEGM